MSTLSDVIGFFCRVGPSFRRQRSAYRIAVMGLLIAILDVSAAKDYCQLDIFEASCPDGSVVLMQRALYGRMQLGRCLPRDYFVGCAADVMVELDSKCSGRQHCRFQIPDHSLLRALACPSDLVAYLEAEYTCIKGETASQSMCTALGHVTTTGSTGYLLSETTQSSGVGSEKCPWTIVARPGQHVRITLFDVQPPVSPPPTTNVHRQQQQLHQLSGVVSARNVSTATGSGVIVNSVGAKIPAVDGRCVLYATIRESAESGVTVAYRGSESSSRENVVCSRGVGSGVGVAATGGSPLLGSVGARQTAVYTMTTHSVTVTTYNTPGARFMLKYEAVGCADPVLPPTNAAQIIRRGDQVDIVCNYSGNGAQRRHHSLQQQQQQASVHSWHLVCHQTQWIGDFGNCTNGASSVSSIESTLPDDDHQQAISLSYGLWFAVAAGLFLGITIGCSLLLLVCFKRQSSDKELPTAVVSNDGPAKYAPYRSYQFDASDCGDEITSGCDAVTSSKIPLPPFRRSCPPPSCAIYSYRVDQDMGVVGLQTGTGSGASTCVHHYARHCLCHEAAETVPQTKVLQ